MESLLLGIVILCSGAENEFLVVHNGVITNHEVLKQMLIRHGFTFESETNTEVIPKLAKYVFDKSNEDSGDTTVTFSLVVLEVMRQLEGAYALIFKSRHYPNELIACKHGSSLLLGVNELTEESSKGSLFSDDKYPSQNGNPRELFLSSDANALAEHTRKVLVIQDGEVVHLKLNSSLVHFQWRGRLICGGTCKAKSVLLVGLKDHLKTIRRSPRIVFIGCGTSYNAALASRPILEELSGIPVTMEMQVIFWIVKAQFIEKIWQFLSVSLVKQQIPYMHWNMPSKMVHYV